MTLHFTSGTNTAANASAYQVTGGEWASGTIQWSNKPAANVLLQSNISHNNVTGYVFSCLTAVQHWYDGDPTGQNENYGIMLRYYNESTADYNAVYSADYSDATKRPSLTIYYQPATNEVGMLVGQTRTLTVPDYEGTITWTSSNPAVATVSSSGVVTSVKVGATTVTAYGGGNELKKFNVYVKIQDGVYYIKNNGGSYLGTSGQCANGTKTYLYTKATSGRALLNQLWRIDYLRQGNYSIRPLYNMNMALCSEGGVPGSVVITTIGTEDVPGASRWSICSSTTGFELYCAGTSYMTLCCDQSYPGSAVVTKNGSANPSGRYWSLESAPDVSPQLLLMDVQTGASIEGNIYYINRGETVTLEELGIVASFVHGYSLNQSMSFYSQNSANVSVDSTTGTMTANIPDGNSIIYVKHFHNGVEYKKSFVVVVNKEMTQFIEKMGALYDVAYKYAEGNQKNPLETLFNFIRAQRYNGVKWDGIVGEQDHLFSILIEEMYPDLYSYFIFDSENGYVNTVSDTCSNVYIDVIHMAYVLNRLFYTGTTNYFVIPNVGVIEEVVDDLSGWAGDSQSLIAQYLGKYKDDETYEDIYFNFYQMIGNDAYKFNYADIISDLDACNLYILLSSQPITTGEQFKAVLTDYYSGTEGNVAAKRFTTWIGSYTGDTLQDKFYDYCNDYSPYAINWPILLGYSVTDEQQEVFSQALADYFWAQKLKE